MLQTRDLPISPLIGLMIGLSMATSDLHAQTTAKRPSYATRDELRACLDGEDQLKATRDLLQQKMAAHDSQMKQWQDAMNEHVDGETSVDTHDQDAVDAFNARTDTLNGQGAALNKEVDQLNAQQHDFNREISAHNRQCAAMVVSAADQAFVLKERAARLKKASAAASGI